MKTGRWRESTRLQKGSALVAHAGGTLWRVESGAFGILSEMTDPRAMLQGIARTGDVIGIELITGEPAPASVCALIEGRLQRLQCRSMSEENELLRQAHAQSRRQCRELLQLRVGLVHDRLALLLLLLGTSGGPEPGSTSIPSLRHLSMILDSAQETICRALADIRHGRADAMRGRTAARTSRGRRRAADAVAPR